MQLPTSTLFILLISLTSVVVVEAKYHEPTTASPDYQKCKHGIESDPSCVPLTSDEQVSQIRDSKGRFLLLNEKHPELKSYIKQQTKSPYMLPTTTYIAISPTNTVVATTTPVAPMLIAPELSMGAMPTQVFGKRLLDLDLESLIEEKGIDNINKNSILIKKDSNEFGFPSIPFYTTTNEESYPPTSDIYSQNQILTPAPQNNPDTAAPADSVGNVKFGGGRWGRPWKRSPHPEPKDCLEETTIIQTATATATETVIQYQTVTDTSPIPTSTPTIVSTVVQDNTGNAKWGFTGGWGRPFVRDISDEIQQISNIVTPIAVPIEQVLPQVTDDTGNKKWGFFGGWGRPWKRQGLVDDGFLSSSSSSLLSTPQVQIQTPPSTPLAYTQILPQGNGNEDIVGNKKWGFFGGWGRPW